MSRKSLAVTSGSVSGKIGVGIDARVVTDFGCAFGSILPSGPVIVGRDGRSTGEHYARSVISALNAVGREVYAVGIAPSATLAVAVRELKAAGAISITPGDLPKDYSGLKFYGKNGQLIDQKSMTSLLKKSLSRKFSFVGSSKVGQFKMNYSCLGRHIQAVTEIPAINLMDINRARLQVVVDCGNAGGSAIVGDFLRCIGVRVTEVDCLAGPGFTRVPTIGSKVSTAVRREVKKLGADLGIIVDADASRISLVDEKGAAISIESLLCAAVAQGTKIHENSVGVVGLSKKRTWAHLKKFAKREGISLWNADAGETTVLKALSRKKSSLAIDADGTLWYKQGTGTADALVTLALALSTICSARKPASEVMKSILS